MTSLPYLDRGKEEAIRRQDTLTTTPEPSSKPPSPSVPFSESNPFALDGPDPALDIKTSTITEMPYDVTWSASQVPGDVTWANSQVPGDFDTGRVIMDGASIHEELDTTLVSADNPFSEDMTHSIETQVQAPTDSQIQSG